MSKKVKNIFSILPILFLLFSFMYWQSNNIATTALAVTTTSTDSATESENTSSDSATKTLKDRIQRVVAENQDKVKGLINDKSQQQALAGQVIRLTEEALTIKTAAGTQIIPIPSQAAIIKANKPIKLVNVAIDNWITLIGDLVDDEFKPYLLIADDDAPKTRNYHFYLGNITETTRNSLTISPRDQSENVDILVNNSTSITDLEDSKTTFAKLDTDLQALVVAYDGDNGKVATSIKVLTTIE